LALYKFGTYLFTYLAPCQWANTGHANLQPVSPVYCQTSQTLHNSTKGDMHVGTSNRPKQVFLVSINLKYRCS